MKRGHQGQPEWQSPYSYDSYDSKISNSRPDLGSEPQTQNQLPTGHIHLDIL